MDLGRCEECMKNEEEDDGAMTRMRMGVMTTRVVTVMTRMIMLSVAVMLMLMMTGGVSKKEQERDGEFSPLLPSRKMLTAVTERCLSLRFVKYLCF